MDISIISAHLLIIKERQFITASYIPLQSEGGTQCSPFGLGLFVCVGVWVCETYVVHYLNGTGLCCAPPTCVVHHWPVLCTMEHKGDLCRVFGASGLTANIHRWCTRARTYNMIFFVVDNEHVNQGSQCSNVPMYTLLVHNVAFCWLGGAQGNFACSLSALTVVTSAQYDVVSLAVFHFLT